MKMLHLFSILNVSANHVFMGGGEWLYHLQIFIGNRFRFRSELRPLWSVVDGSKNY